MELIYIVIAMLASILVDSGDAIQCYECASTPTTPGPTNCLDPFNVEGIPKVQCEGRCYANSSTSTFSGQSFQQVARGCEVNAAECIPAMCQDMNAPDGSGSGRFCSYCCEGELCNSLGFEEAAAATNTCWYCEVDLVEGMVPAPMSCSSDDFNGEGAIAIPCQTKCASMKTPPDDEQGNPAKFTRACDFSNNLCSQSAFDMFEIDCCEGNLCNVGKNITGGDNDDDDDDDGEEATAKPDGEGDDDDDDDDVGPIQCWKCNSVVANKTEAKSACEKGNFPADNVEKVNCPSGECIRYSTVADANSTSIFTRKCVTPEMDALGYCGDNNAIKDAECCKTDLCNKLNKASGVRVISVTTILSALFICVCVELM